MSFYTALTGLNGAQSDISATSNNVANVGTTGFKRSRAEFGDIFATSPLQNNSSAIGSGAILKGVKQQFTQGNIASSLNALDMAISGQGFFALKPSLTSTQVVYTRNGSFNVDNNRNVVDSSGQFLLAYPVNEDGSVTAKDINSASPLRLPVTSGDPQATSMVDLAVNVPASADVVTDKEKFADGYTFDPEDPESFTNSTSFTIFDDLGNPTIATVYFIKTQRATAEDPTNKFETRLVINDEVVPPDLVPAVTSSDEQIFIDRFGNQTTAVPDASYTLEQKSSPLYKLDEQNDRVPSQPAALTGQASSFNFGDEGTGEIEIVTDPMQFGATYEANPDANQGVYWGRDFLLVNIDDGTRPVSIDVRAGRYNAEQLAAEVERAINAAHDDARKLEIQKGVDDKISLQLFQSTTSGDAPVRSTPLEVDLLQPSFVSIQAGMDLSESTSPNFDLDVFLAHAQTRLNDTLNSDPGFVPGASDKQFAQLTGGTKISEPPADPEVFDFEFTTRDLGVTTVTPPTGTSKWGVTYSNGTFTVSDLDSNTGSVSGNITISFSGFDDLTFDISGLTAAADVVTAIETAVANSGYFPKLLTENAGASTDFAIIKDRHLAYTNVGDRPTVAVYDQKLDVSTGGDAISLDSQNNRLIITMGTTVGTSLNEGDTIVLMGANEQAEALNGRSFRITGIDGDEIEIATGGLGLPEEDISIAGTDYFVLSGRSSDVEAYFEGAALDVEGSATSFNNQRLVLRETDAARHAYTDSDLNTDFGVDIFDIDITGNVTGSDTTAAELGLDSTTTDMAWVDELNPPIEVAYDAATQSIVFNVDHTTLGPGGAISNLSAIQVSSSSNAGVNAFGLAGSSSPRVEITSATSVQGQPFVFDGANQGDGPTRFGAKVSYDREARAFTFESGTTGEAIAQDKALGVPTAQKASNIQVGRYEIDPATKSARIQPGAVDLASRVLALGENDLMGVGSSKNVSFAEGTGLQSLPARAVGAPATDPLNSNPVFLNPANKETTFNVSVNGINAVIEIPGGNYIGSTLAERLQERINQMQDPVTGKTIGGVTVRYQPNDNNFVFTTETTGSESTIRVRGPAKLGLDDVPLGIGSVPSITNLVQATNENGVPLFVNENGEIVDSEPDNLVEGYYPLYLNEGELTFDKTGRLISPQGLTRYEAQTETFSISLDIDYSDSSQLATPFVVNNLEQNGFTSGRLDGLSIDATGLLRANYTNGQNKPLGRIVLANFNNQNGLKQVGNATFVQTASSGDPIIGEAGTEGFGSIQSGALERSNVDITEELVNLITAQRNFQASSKAIETSTQLTQTIINIRT
ncbi:flagellar hook-basal body complex protein [Lacimonas salitolerans]|uniref:Flagellar hook protein FlgE n=1 Tax=Lacimonas salitolerans TaxID=1323750 RepID=A0ABW4EJU5_9RHOB